MEGCWRDSTVMIEWLSSNAEVLQLVSHNQYPFVPWTKAVAIVTCGYSGDLDIYHCETTQQLHQSYPPTLTGMRSQMHHIHTVPKMSCFAIRFRYTGYSNLCWSIFIKPEGTQWGRSYVHVYLWPIVKESKLTSSITYSILCTGKLNYLGLIDCQYKAISHRVITGR